MTQALQRAIELMEEGDVPKLLARKIKRLDEECAAYLVSLTTLEDLEENIPEMMESVSVYENYVDYTWHVESMDEVIARLRELGKLGFRTNPDRAQAEQVGDSMKKWNLIRNGKERISIYAVFPSSPTSIAACRYFKVGEKTVDVTELVCDTDPRYQELLAAEEANEARQIT